MLSAQVPCRENGGTCGFHFLTSNFNIHTFALDETIHKFTDLVNYVLINSSASSVERFCLRAWPLVMMITKFIGG